MRLYRGLENRGNGERVGGGAAEEEQKRCLQLTDKIASQLSGISSAATPPYCSSTYADRLTLTRTRAFTFPARGKSTGVPVFANLLFKLGGTIQIPTSRREPRLVWDDARVPTRPRVPAFRPGKRSPGIGYSGGNCLP